MESFKYGIIKSLPLLEENFKLESVSTPYIGVSIEKGKYIKGQLQNGENLERKYFHDATFAGLWHDEKVLERDGIDCQEHQLNFPALSKLVYAYENDIPIILKS